MEDYKFTKARFERFLNSTQESTKKIYDPNGGKLGAKLVYHKFGSLLRTKQPLLFNEFYKLWMLEEDKDKDNFNQWKKKLGTKCYE